MEQSKIWVVVENMQEVEEGVIFQIAGVFDSESKANDACYNSRCGIGPMYINEALPIKTIEWPGFYYPSLN